MTNRTINVVTTHAIMNTSDDCWTMYVQGSDVRSISQTVDESIESIVERLERMLQESNVDPPPPHVQVPRLVDELQFVRRAAWSGWKRSLQDKQKTIEKKSVDAKGGTRTDTTVTKESQSGDAAFLRIVLECNRREASLRGVEKSQQSHLKLNQRPLDIDALIELMEAEQAADQQSPSQSQLLP